MCWFVSFLAKLMLLAWLPCPCSFEGFTDPLPGSISCICNVLWRHTQYKPIRVRSGSLRLLKENTSGRRLCCFLHTRCQASRLSRTSTFTKFLLTFEEDLARVWKDAFWNWTLYYSTKDPIMPQINRSCLPLLVFHVFAKPFAAKRYKKVQVETRQLRKTPRN